MSLSSFWLGKSPLPNSGSMVFPKHTKANFAKRSSEAIFYNSTFPRRNGISIADTIVCEGGMAGQSNGVAERAASERRATDFTEEDWHRLDGSLLGYERPISSDSSNVFAPCANSRKTLRRVVGLGAAELK
ncbi:MAG: hypothetical protein WDM79_15590 [Terricaulis sp.]